MLDQKPARQKFLINCTDGKNNIERATVSFVMDCQPLQTMPRLLFLQHPMQRSFAPKVEPMT